MEQVRHGSAPSTRTVRAAIQQSHNSISELSRELGINPKTVAKWRKRKTAENRKTGFKESDLFLPFALAVCGSSLASGRATQFQTIKPVHDRPTHNINNCLREGFG